MSARATNSTRTSRHPQADGAFAVLGEAHRCPEPGRAYVKAEGREVTRALFEENLEGKLRLS
jgi:hypothetical protein